MNNNRQPMGTNDFWGRALLYTGLGLLFRLRGGKLAACAILGPIAERTLGITAEEVLAKWQRQQQEKEKQEIIKKVLQNWANTGQATSQLVKKHEEVVEPSTTKQIDIAKDHKWLKIIPHPSVVIIIGRRGSGKSALAYWLLELYRYRALSFVLGMPQQVRKLLPEWLGIINDPNDAPQGSTLLVDEAYLRFSARESQKLSNREISRIVNLSRQKRLTLIFVTQQASYIDKNLASALDVLVIKEPAPLQTKFERHEINEIVRTAAEKFRVVSGDRRVWSLVYSQAANFFDMLPNSLPSFWNDRLSRVYASSGTLSETKPAGKTTKKEKVRRVKQLHSMGIPVSQIMEDVGVRSRTTVYNYLKIPDIKSEQK